MSKPGRKISVSPSTSNAGKGNATVSKRKNSRAKGAAGELEFSKFLQNFGFTARRGQQFSGGPGSPDVVHNLPDIHFEVKRTEVTAIYDWLTQAGDDTPKGHLPIIAHRKNGHEWIAIVDMDAL